MSALDPIDLLADDDSVDTNNDLGDEGVGSDNNENAVQLFMEFCGRNDRSEAVKKLKSFSFDVHQALASEFRHEDAKKTASPMVSYSSAKDSRLTRNTSIGSRGASECQKFDNNEEREITQAQPNTPKSPMSTEWYSCMASSHSSIFIDKEFPPKQSSLDGRQRPSQADRQKVVECLCGIPASARTVQSDGPNYGRFYLCCGVPRRKRQGGSSKEKIITPCKFFKWDDRNGSIGAGGGYSMTAFMTWEFFGTSNQCVTNGASFSPDSVRQGAIGNCWFLSALAVVAEKQYLIDQLLPARELNNTGCYQVNLCLDGKWCPVIVDSHLPVVHGSRVVDPLRGGSAGFLGNLPSKKAQPAFCAVPDGQLWPALIEKAYAKAHGSYANLDGGFIQEAFGDLTGAPTETILFEGNCWDLDALWARLLSFHQAGFLLGVATSRGGDGLVGGHAYSVLDVTETHNAVVGQQQSIKDFVSHHDDEPPRRKRPRTTVRLLRIRNPWGKKEWKGEWSVNSDKWTSVLRKKLGKEQSYAKNDGTFFMSFTDMLQRFHHMDIAKCRKGWRHASLGGSFLTPCDPLDSPQAHYKLIVNEKSWAFVSIIQPKKRANTKTTYWYADPSLIVLKRKRGEVSWLCEAITLAGFMRSSTVEVFLDPDYDYRCVPFSCKSSHDGKRQAPFRIVVYSAEQVHIEKTEKSGRLLQDALAIIHNRLLRDERKLLYAVAPESCLACVHGNRCLYFIAVNASSDNYLSLQLRMAKTPKGLLVSFGSSKETHDVRPRSQRLLLVVASDGTVASADSSIEFTYLSDLIEAGSSRPLKGHATKLSSHVDITMLGELLTANKPRDGIAFRNKGGDTIETFQWLAHIGASV